MLFLCFLEYSWFASKHSFLDGLDLFSREVPLKDAKEYADSIGAIVVETSAKNAINIEELFQGISKCRVCIVSLILLAWLCFGSQT